MNYILVAASFFIILTSYSQNFLAENKDHYQVLYRGFNNTVVFTQIDESQRDYETEAVNCEISLFEKDGRKDIYVIKANSKAPTAQVNFKVDGKVVDSVQFIVQNLPIPSLFWGMNRSGTQVANSPELQVLYKSGITLKPNFKIVRWEYKHGNKKFAGEGNSLSNEALEYSLSLAEGEEVHITVKVENVDGVPSELKGSWKKIQT